MDYLCFQFSVTYDDQTEEFQAGTSAKGLLREWRRARDDPKLGAQACFGEVLVWGQPAAWADQVICSWASDYVASLYPQAIQLVDCLGAQWEPDVLLRQWLNQQLQIPVAPNATSFLQPADTHCHSQLKAIIVEVKSRLEEEWDRQSKQMGQQREYKWGPAETLQVVAEAIAIFRQRFHLRKPEQQKDPEPESDPENPPTYGPEPRPKVDLFLKGFIQNQLLIFRPDHQETLQLFETFRQGWEQDCPRVPPGRGISLETSSKRVVFAQEKWVDGQPAKPDWSLLDKMGNYLEQQHHQDHQKMLDEPILDLRFQNLDLSPEQIEMIRPPEERMSDLPKVRHSVAQKTSQLQKIQNRRKHL